MTVSGTRRCLDLNVKILYFFGFWPEDGEEKRTWMFYLRYLTPRILFIRSIYGAAFHIINIWITWGNISEMVEYYVILMTYLMIGMHCGTLFHYRVKLRALVDELEALHDPRMVPTDDMKKCLVATERLTHRTAKIVFMSTTCLIVISQILQIFEGISTRLLPFRLWLPYKYDESPLFEVTLVVTAVLPIFDLSGIVICATSFACPVLLIIGQYKLLSYKLQNMQLLLQKRVKRIEARQQHVSEDTACAETGDMDVRSRTCSVSKAIRSGNNDAHTIASHSWMSAETGDMDVRSRTSSVSKASRSGNKDAHTIASHSWMSAETGDRDVVLNVIAINHRNETPSGVKTVNSNTKVISHLNEAIYLITTQSGIFPVPDDTRVLPRSTNSGSRQHTTINISEDVSNTNGIDQFKDNEGFYRMRQGQYKFEATTHEVKDKNEEIGVDFNLIEMENYLRHCIKHHQKILSITKMLQCIFKGVLDQYVLYSAVGGLVMLYVTSMDSTMDSKKVAITLLMSGLYVQLLGVCWVGELLSGEAENARDAVYDCDWFGASESFKRSMRIMVSRMNRPLVIKAAGLPLSASTFRMICRVAYYFRMVLRRILSGEKICK